MRCIARQQAHRESHGPELANRLGSIGTHFVLEAEGGAGNAVATEPDFSGGLATVIAEAS